MSWILDRGIILLNLLSDWLIKKRFRENNKLYINDELVEGVKSYKFYEVDNETSDVTDINSCINKYIAVINTNGYLEIYLYYNQKAHKNLVKDSQKDKSVRIVQGNSSREFKGIMKNFVTEYNDSEYKSIAYTKIMVNSVIVYKDE